MTISIFDFKYHILVGHVLPALPLYLFGLYTFLKHLRIAFYATGPAQGFAKVIFSLVTSGNNYPCCEKTFPHSILIVRIS